MENSTIRVVLWLAASAIVGVAFLAALAVTQDALLLGVGLALIPIYFAERRTSPSRSRSVDTPTHGSRANGDVRVPRKSNAYGFSEPPSMKVCPDCAEEIRLAARKCRFCGHQFDPVSAAS